ncbi:hypothetical protein BHU72_02600 [Desulfuribacillus stibiiarsenatis]|uniref:Stage V sporulation protein AA domain-containing protein n=1 Tax=Desulfuribacillus stibiiarsenatis TaxID=1390249 RepID=A0A1E5L6W1_9FIRM|nr:stage V sporulation protein AA [Desulfuribacillus stibiiarsenatis]OEH85703.1 hypothetical protein BHU72_02600 [Desulfuribacillus stibiiarsenatis]
MSEIVLQMKQKIVIAPQVINLYVKDIARVTATNACIVGEVKVYTLTEEDGNICVISALDVIKEISIAIPNSNINLIGADHIIVEKTNEKKSTNVFFVGLAWLVLFFGAGLTIMNFHEDVSMKEVHQNLHFLLSGEENDNPYWLQIPYSLGVGLGMIIFFNHLFKKKITEEPSPLDVEMFLYQENVDKYLIKKQKNSSKDSN